jgi:hypothetical protein
MGNRGAKRRRRRSQALAMHAPALDDVFRKATREQSPDPELRKECARTIHREATRLDAVYRRQMEVVSRARAEEAALLCDVLAAARPALPGLASPLLVLDVSLPSRPALLHLRAFLLFGATPEPGVRASQQPAEGLFLVDDATFLRVRFTGVTAPTDAGPRALCADRLEGVEVRGVLRDHGAQHVVDVLERGIAAQAARRRAQVRDVEAHVARLAALRTLLSR